MQPRVIDSIVALMYVRVKMEQVGITTLLFGCLYPLYLQNLPEGQGKHSVISWSPLWFG